MDHVKDSFSNNIRSRRIIFSTTDKRWEIHYKPNDKITGDLKSYNNKKFLSYNDSQIVYAKHIYIMETPSIKGGKFKYQNVSLIDVCNNPLHDEKKVNIFFWYFVNCYNLHCICFSRSRLSATFCQRSTNTSR